MNAAKTLELKQTRVFVDDKAADVSDTQMLEHERLSIELKEEIKKGQQVRLEFEYKSELGEDCVGAYDLSLSIATFDIDVSQAIPTGYFRSLDGPADNQITCSATQ